MLIQLSIIFISEIHTVSFTRTTGNLPQVSNFTCSSNIDTSTWKIFTSLQGLGRSFSSLQAPGRFALLQRWIPTWELSANTTGGGIWSVYDCMVLVQVYAGLQCLTTISYREHVVVWWTEDCLQVIVLHLVGRWMVLQQCMYNCTLYNCTFFDL